MDALPLMEAFYTLQGEGYHQGKAAVFIRQAVMSAAIGVMSKNPGMLKFIHLYLLMKS